MFFSWRPTLPHASCEIFLASLHVPRPTSPPLAVSDWSTSSATEDEYSDAEDEVRANATDPFAVHLQDLIGESEEEAAAAVYYAARLSASEQGSESSSGDGRDAGEAMDRDTVSRRLSGRSSMYAGSMQVRGCVEWHERPAAKGHAKYTKPVEPKPTQRVADRARNYKNYLAQKLQARDLFKVIATAAKAKLDIAFNNFFKAKKGWGDDVAADPTQLTRTVKAMSCCSKQRACERTPWVPTELFALLSAPWWRRRSPALAPRPT